MMDKIDYKKRFKVFYGASAKKIAVVDVPEMNFLMIDGKGDPNTSEEFKDAVEALFSVSYTLKFMIKKGPSGVDYGVMPLEGLWWSEDVSDFATGKKDNWLWTAMIMQPDPVTRDLYAEAADEVERKKSPKGLHKMRFEPFKEGLSAQVMHIGHFSEEGPTIERLHEYIAESGHVLSGKHHEIYLSDMRRAAPEKWKTIVRQPIRPAG